VLVAQQRSGVSGVDFHPVSWHSNLARLRGVAQPGSAFGSGPKGRRFKSSRPDNSNSGFWFGSTVLRFYSLDGFYGSTHSMVGAAEKPFRGSAQVLRFYSRVLRRLRGAARR
jgi:hypothetical protein